MLTRENILERALPKREVQVPEWGGLVYVRPITLAEQGRLMDASASLDAKSTPTYFEKMKVTAKLICWTVCDDNGARVFTEADVAELINRQASAIYRLQDAILDFSGLTKESREELEKNLLLARNAEQGSSSPTDSA